LFIFVEGETCLEGVVKVAKRRKYGVQREHEKWIQRPYCRAFPFRQQTLKSSVDELREALRVVEQKKGKPIFEHFIEAAYEDNSVLTALMKKLIPDLKQLDAFLEMRGHFSFEGMTDEELEEYINELADNDK